MKIELDTNNLTDLDRAILVAVVETINTGKAPEQAASAAPKTKLAPKAKPAPVAEEVLAEDAEELIAPADSADSSPEGPTMGDAVAAATKLVSSGASAKVKAALTDLGVKRVSELPKDKIEAFLTALEA